MGRVQSNDGEPISASCPISRDGYDQTLFAPRNYKAHKSESNEATLACTNSIANDAAVAYTEPIANEAAVAYTNSIANEAAVA